MSDYQAYRDAVAKAIAERREKVEALTQDGLTPSQIAARLGVTRRTVERDRRDLKLSRPHRPFPPEEDRRALELIADGCSLREVAETLGRNYNTIMARYKGKGWTDQQVGEYNALRELRRRVLDDEKEPDYWAGP